MASLCVRAIEVTRWPSSPRILLSSAAISGSSSMISTSVAIWRPISLLACLQQVVDPGIGDLEDLGRLAAVEPLHGHQQEGLAGLGGNAASDRAAVMPISSACAAGSTRRVVNAFRKHW